MRCWHVKKRAVGSADKQVLEGWRTWVGWWRWVVGRKVELGVAWSIIAQESLGGVSTAQEGIGRADKILRGCLHIESVSPE